MKKLLTLLMLLCMVCTGAWAQTFSAGKHYTFRNRGNNSYVCYDASVTSGGNTILTGKNIGSAFLLEGDDTNGYKIRLVENPDLYVFAVGTGNNDSNVGIKALGTDNGSENKYIWRIQANGTTGGFCITPKTGASTWGTNAWNRRGTINSINTIGMWEGDNTSGTKYMTDDNTWYIEDAIVTGHYYTIKAHFTDNNGPYLFNTGTTLGISTDVSSVGNGKYWVANVEDGDYPVAFASSLNQSKYLSGESGLEDSRCGFSFGSDKKAWRELRGKADNSIRNIGTWKDGSGFGKFGTSCYSTTGHWGLTDGHTWTTYYDIEEISISYLVESNLTTGGVTYTSSAAVGVNANVTRGHYVLTLASSISEEELTPVEVAGYDANVTIDETNKRIKVTYTFKEGLYNLSLYCANGDKYGVTANGNNLRITNTAATPDAFIIVPSGKTNATVNQPTYYIKNMAGTSYLTYDANLGSQKEVLILNNKTAGITWDSSASGTTPPDGYFMIAPLNSATAVRSLAGKPDTNLGFAGRTLPTVYFNHNGYSNYYYSWAIDEDAHHAYYTINCTGLQNEEVGGICYNRVNYTDNRVILPVGFDKSALIAMHVSGYNGTVEVNDATKTITVTYSDANETTSTLWHGNVATNSNQIIPASRIPAIITTNSGEILAFSDWRYNFNDIGRGDMGGHIDIEMRRSTDGGQTWKPAIIAARGTGSGTTAGYGDAAVVADRTTGESQQVLLLAAAGSVSYTANNRSNSIRMAKFTSTNNGATWSEATDITSDIFAILPETVKGFFATSGKITQASFKAAGASHNRIYTVLCTTTDAGSTNTNYVIYSDDFGAHWAVLGGTETPAMAGGNEAHVTELPNGDLLLDSRAGGRLVNLFTYSDKDAATGTWGASGQKSINVGTACNGDIDLVDCYKRGSSDPVKVLIQSAPRASSRSNIRYYYKELPAQTDGHYTLSDFVGGWTEGYQVCAGSSAYSSITSAGTGVEYMLYEKNTNGNTFNYDIEFEKHDISLITNGNYFSVDPTGEKTIKYTLTDVNGTTYEGETTGEMGTTPTFTGCDGMTFNKASWGMEGEKVTYTANVVFPFPVGTPTYITGEPSGTLCYWTVNETTCQTNNTLGATNQTGSQEKWEWIITPSLNNLAFTFTLKNVAADKYITGTSAANTVSVAATGTGYEYKTCMSKKGFAVPNGNIFLSVNSSTAGNKNLILWNKSGSHTGSDLQFHTPADFDALMTALQTAKTCPGTEGTKVGQYSASNATAEQLTLAQNIIDGTAYATAAKFQELTTAISYTLNMPQPGHFYRLKGVATGKYLTCTNGRYNNNDNVYEMAADKTTGDNAKNTILYYGPDNKLVMYGTGYGFANGMQATLDANTTFTFQADTQGAVGKYNVKGVYGSSTIYLWNYSTNLARNGSVTPECVWELEEVTSLPLTVGETTFATFYTPVNVAVPSGITPYVCNLSGDNLAMYTCKQNTTIVGREYTVIPAHTAVMIKSNNAQTYSLSVVEDESIEEYTNNSFFGDVATKAFAEDYTYYSLQRDNTANDGSVGFFIKPSGNFKGFQAFLKTENTQQVQRFNVTFDEDAVITGFANVLGTVNINIPAFDLSGRKVDANSHRGLYIMNGKKVIR